ncbi:MAG: group II intron reverse transcriptase/maturase [Alphaproteobacteria bacterium]|nr:group II intron reverse transcriptase/maturase [Alphaproteobacteria bacterium]
MMNDPEKSDSAIVAGKSANKVGQPAAEPMEPRAEAEGNAGRQRTRRAQDRESVSQALDRIRHAAKTRKKEQFTALFHHLSTPMLRMAFFALKREAAPGVDGLTWQDYEADLDRRIEDLHARVQRGAYRALPSRRRYIPKPDGRQRPLAVAALEDKIVQRATVAVLNAIYEEDFLGFSYGFRPQRGPHDALDALVVGITSTKVNYILDADIRSFFDEVSQSWLERFLKHRIGDKRILRLIQKWLKAGVLEDGIVTVSDKGTGQGSVISPLLANVYLHYAIDLWAERWRRREATGDMIIVRYADDIVIGFEYEAEAHRFWDAMRARLAEFALTLHPEKTRLIEFGRHAAARRARRGLGKPETFGFLGFTFICGQSRRGRFLLKRKTRRDRMRAKLREIKEQMRRRRHQPIPEQGTWLKQVVTGFFGYHAVPTNGAALRAFRYHIVTLWRRSLQRRSQRAGMTWERISKLAEDWLPQPRILHPWPNQRFAVKHPRWEPDARMGPVRFCPGGAR